MKNRVRAVLFDLDGTLIDSAPDLGAAAEKMRVQRGLPPLGLDAYRLMAGAGARGMMGVAFGMSPDAPEYEAFKNEFLSNYQMAMTIHTRAFDGVADVLARLTALQWPWGIVTNKAERFTLPLVHRRLSAETPRRMPNPIPSPCWKPPGGCGCLLKPVFMWGMTNAILPRAVQQAC